MTFFQQLFRRISGAAAQPSALASPEKTIPPQAQAVLSSGKTAETANNVPAGNETIAATMPRDNSPVVIAGDFSKMMAEILAKSQVSFSAEGYDLFDHFKLCLPSVFEIGRRRGDDPIVVLVAM